jgi:protocatechuate 4,5-dioxygenase alpha chain
MTRPPREYDDIPGTYVFDGARSRSGYALNMFCMSLNRADGRDAFRADPEGYLDRWDLSPEQRAAVERRDWLEMLRLGGNIYYLFKLAAFDGVTVQDLSGAMTGVTRDEFIEMMVGGGRPIDGNRSRSEQAAPTGQEGQEVR